MSVEKITNYILIFSRGIIYDWCLQNGNYDIEDFSKKAFIDFFEIFQTTNR